MNDLRIFSDRSQMSRSVAQAFVDSARERTAEDARFSLVLSGGSTPRLLYKLLGSEFRSQVPWERVHFFFSDERYVPFDHPESNYRMVREALFDRINVPATNVHRPRTDMDDPEEAAARYEEELRGFLGAGEPALDWVLLGLGEDGHIASLFPRAAALEETERWVTVVRDSPKPPPMRLTMTIPLLNRASQVHFLVSGGGKAKALQATLEGERNPMASPAQQIEPDGKTIIWWVDEEAARGLSASGLDNRPD